MFSDTFKVINNIRNELCDIAAQGALIIELMDEIAALKAEIDNRADGISLAEVKTND